MRKRIWGLAPTLAVMLAAAACDTPTESSAADFPTFEGTRADLGRLLFWDPVLSGPQDIACATCHHPDFAWADARGLALGTGSAGLGPARIDLSGGVIPPVKRNSPTVLNVALNGVDNGDPRSPTAALATVDAARAPMFWDSRVLSLENQALEPLEAFDEMRGNAYPEALALDSVVARLRGIPEYVAAFEYTFPDDGEAVTAAHLGQAIAAFERTLLALESPVDRFRAGDSTALTAQQRRGQQVFDRVGCDNCHEGAMFSDYDEHAEGVGENALVAVPDSGAGRFRFRTPSLRNVELTAPYMHNGVLATLEDVLRFYDAGRSENPNVLNVAAGQRGGNDGVARLDVQFVRVGDMSERDMQDIIAFLRGLTDIEFERTAPTRVPSGLRAGGRIAGP